MARVGGRQFLAAAAATFLIAAACRDAQGPEPQASLLPGLPGVGALAVSTLTTGSPVDPDGYTVTVDNGPSQHIATTGVVTFTGLSIGPHTVTLSGVASNCTCITTLSVTIPLTGTGSVTFSVTCAAQPPPPQSGDLTVSTSTTGSNLDPDGYTVTLDGSTNRPIGTNGSVTFTGLSAGNHTAALSGVAGNCAVSDGASRTVDVPAGGTTSTTFSVSCAATAPPPAGRVTGQGQLGTAPPQPGNDVLTFDFDVRADLTGRFTGTDYADLRPSGQPASVTTDHASDPETAITAFRPSSGGCSDPSRGVEFDAVGRDDTGALLNYTIAVCDNGPANSGADFFDIFITSNGFRRSGQVASGDVAKS